MIITGLIWIGHAGWIAIDPMGMEYPGYKINAWAMKVHVATFYGAFETFLGVFAIVTARNLERNLRASLVLWTLLYLALAAGRIIGILHWDDGNFFLVGGAAVFPASYNAGALITLEGPSAVLFTIVLIATWKKFRRCTS